jgi:ArsR family transcriptional regulator
MLTTKTNRYTNFFKALSSEQRINIIKIIMQEKQINVTQLQKKIMFLEMSSISAHLKILLDAKILSYKKEGKFNYYTVNHKVFTSEYYKFLEEMNLLFDFNVGKES